MIAKASPAESKIANFGDKRVFFLKSYFSSINFDSVNAPLESFLTVNSDAVTDSCYKQPRPTRVTDNLHGLIVTCAQFELEMY